ncbi:hypothetical protein HIM_08034 [Hirsutella minnesotensis 3608]|uniref:Histidine-specific methyltransferase SAM-dependent domain-containing protein n=1 Tax=Hirsutella minnesotensis 3608 TaxID=1043627 RepID=A0A0F7ZMS5_9HYPO|nr:hypothetical protein HIM_08034 [Hirsutella minnesotensis 3608]
MSQTQSQTVVLQSHPLQTVQLQDIAKSGLLDLKECIVIGLASTPKTMPSLLLWDSQGLRNFDAWANDPAYYPKRCEWEILRNHRHDIANHFPASSVLIELGCGNLSKTACLLAALEHQKRHVRYFALDVSDEALHKNLAILRRQFIHSKFVSISGLSGTYDDCAEWLATSAKLPVSNVTFLWLGNSVANMARDEVSSLMGQLRLACRNMSAECRFLVSADCCTDRDRILKAYNPNEGPSRTFLFHGLHHANRLLGRPVFNEKDWDAVPKWEEVDHELQYSYVPNKDVKLDIGHGCVEIKRGEPIAYFMSGKWHPSQMGSIAENAGLAIGKMWMDTRQDYGMKSCSHLFKPVYQI